MLIYRVYMTPIQREVKSVQVLVALPFLKQDCQQHFTCQIDNPLHLISPLLPSFLHAHKGANKKIITPYKTDSFFVLPKKPATCYIISLIAAHPMIQHDRKKIKNNTKVNPG